LGRPYLKEVSEKDEIEKIKELFAIREEGYLKSATHVITTDNKNITQLVSEIIALI
jgi:shikimate kinase